MRADSPKAWAALNHAAGMLHDNPEAIEKCQTSVTEAKKLVRCTMEIGPRS